MTRLDDLEKTLSTACTRFAEAIVEGDEAAASRWWAIALLLVVAEPRLRLERAPKEESR